MLIQSVFSNLRNWPWWSRIGLRAFTRYRKFRYFLRYLSVSILSKVDTKNIDTPYCSIRAILWVSKKLRYSKLQIDTEIPDTFLVSDRYFLKYRFRTQNIDTLRIDPILWESTRYYRFTCLDTRKYRYQLLWPIQAVGLKTMNTIASWYWNNRLQSSSTFNPF